MEPRVLQFRLQKYMQSCDLKDVHFHTLRHTYATRCIEAGVDVKTLSEILGHSSASVTINRYVHCSMEMKRKNMEKLHFLDPLIFRYCPALRAPLQTAAVSRIVRETRDGYRWR